MNAKEAARLCMIVSEYCPQQRFTPADEDNHIPGTAAMWATALVDVRLADAVPAATRLAQRQPFISVSEIIAEVRTIRAERLTALPQAQRPVPNVNPDDVPRFLAGVRAIERAIADGEIASDGNGGFMLTSARWQQHALPPGPTGETREIDLKQVFAEVPRPSKSEQAAGRAAREAEARERQRQLDALTEVIGDYEKARRGKLGRKRRMSKTVKALTDSGGTLDGPQVVRDATAS